MSALDYLSTRPAPAAPREYHFPAFERTRGYAPSGYQNGSVSPSESIQNTYLAVPTAASVAIWGRVLTANGSGLRNAIVMLTDTHGVTRTALTSAFGYYRFDDVQTGGTYIISVSSKRYQFATRSVSVSDDLTDFDLIAESGATRKEIK